MGPEGCDECKSGYKMEENNCVGECVGVSECVGECGGVSVWVCGCACAYS